MKKNNLLSVTLTTCAILAIIISGCKKDTFLALENTTNKESGYVEFASGYYDSVVNLMKNNPKGFNLNLIPRKKSLKRSVYGADDIGGFFYNATSPYNIELTAPIEYVNPDFIPYEWYDDLDASHDLDLWAQSGYTYIDKSVIHWYGQYSQRVIGVTVLIPISYLRIPRGRYNSNYSFKFVNNNPISNVSIAYTGSALGVITQHYVNADYDPMSNFGNLTALHSEARTKMRSTSGDVKFDIRASSIPIGASIGAGFTVSTTSLCVYNLNLSGFFQCSNKQTGGYNPLWNVAFSGYKEGPAEDWRD